MGAHTCAQIARHLSLYGWEPVVLTVKERYAELAGDALEGEFPGRVLRTGLLPHPLTLYRLVKSKLPVETTEGAPGNRPRDRGLFRRRLLSLLLVGESYLGWTLPATLAGLRGIRRYRVRHLLSSGPPWACHLVGLLLSRITGLPWIAHFRDPWSQPTAGSVRGAARRIDAALERIVINRATFVVCVTDEHTESLRHAYPGCPAGKFHTIPNGFDGKEWAGLAVDPALTDSREDTAFTITYTGQLYEARSPLPVFKALRTLIDSGDIDRERVRVELIGWCDSAEGRRVADLADDCGIGDRVAVRGPLPRREALRALTRSDLLLLLAEGWTVQIPGKTYEYLRAGRPILALTSEGALPDLLKEMGGAAVIDPRDLAGIASVVRQTYRGWQEGRPLAGADQALVSRFDRRALAGRFAELLTAGARAHGERDSRPPRG